MELAPRKLQETEIQENSIEVDGKIGSFSIIPRIYESKLDKKYGIRLGNVKNGRKSRFKGDLEKNVSFNGSGNYSISQIEKRILKKYEHVPEFCCMRIQNEEELMEHLRIIHELSYNHYVFGKEKNLKRQFPNWCCGYSSDNLLLTLMDKGYSNAANCSNRTYDHEYIMLPFLFGYAEKKGFIVLDPTSDQLFKDKNHAPRNNLFVVFGTKWKYKTDWKDGADLFPKKKDFSEFSNLHTLRDSPGSSLYKSRDIADYFAEVFKNPVDVEIDRI